MALLLLACGKDDGRAREFGVVQSAHGIAKSGGHMHIGCGKLARGPGKAIGHAHDHRFLQAQNKLELGVVWQGLHDGQLCGARVAKKMGNAFADEELDKRLTSVQMGHGISTL